MDEFSHRLEDNQYLTFHLGEEEYGIGILLIKEIIEFSGMTKVPMMPEYIPGVINLRGNVVPVLDLKLRFTKHKTEIQRKSCIIIVEVPANGEKMEIGLLVDSVKEVVDIPIGNIEPPPSFGTNIRLDFIQGVGKLDEKLIVLLKMDKILSFEELHLLETKLQAVE